MVPMIARVWGGAGADAEWTDVPVTPLTTCRDLVDCCRDPGDEPCTLVEVSLGHERALSDSERPLEVLQQWRGRGPVRLVLRYTLDHDNDNDHDLDLDLDNHRRLSPCVPISSQGGVQPSRNGMKEPGPFADTLPGDVPALSLRELRDMACRQQSQIESQRQLLAAREQRLRFLKQQQLHLQPQGAPNQQGQQGQQQQQQQQHRAHEAERLRRLRERVEAQELKLRKLRALRGQVDAQRQGNAALTSDLDSIRALFNEKEKELSVAVAKVEELTRQLEELRANRGGDGSLSVGAADGTQPGAAALELDRLRRELMYRNKLNEQQRLCISQQREALSQRQAEAASVDRRISELQGRLHRKRLLNQQHSATSNANHSNNNNINNNNTILNNNANNKQQAIQQQQQHRPAVVGHAQDQKPPFLLRPGGNVAAVEPYLHVPVPQPQQQQQQQQHQTTSADQQEKPLSQGSHNVHQDDMSPLEFGGSKTDPKYQTLPYNTKFTVSFLSKTAVGGNEVENARNAINSNLNSNFGSSAGVGPANSNMGQQQLQQQQQQQQHQQQQQMMSVAHSTPLSGINKGLAIGVGQQQQQQQQQQQHESSNNKQPYTSGGRPAFGLPPQPFLPGLHRSAPAGAPSSGMGNMAQGSVHQKPVSSVAPTSVQHQKPSPIYQTSSTKIQPVQPQTISSTAPQQMLVLSPPQGTSTPLTGTPESVPTSASVTSATAQPQPSTPKPALPPKPTVPQAKPTPPPPPRQTAHHQHQGSADESLTSFRQQEVTPDESSPAVAPDDQQQQATPPPVPRLPDGLQQPPPPPPTSQAQPPPPPPAIKARGPINLCRKHLSEQPRLKGTAGPGGVHVSINRRIEMPPAFLFPETDAPPSDLVHSSTTPVASSLPTPTVTTSGNSVAQANSVVTSLVTNSTPDDVDRLTAGASVEQDDSVGGVTLALSQQQQQQQQQPVEDNSAVKAEDSSEANSDEQQQQPQQHQGSNVQPGGDAAVVRRKGNLKVGTNSGNSGSNGSGEGNGGKSGQLRRVSFDPLALLLDASLEGELELVRATAGRVPDPSAANDEGITALHNAICAGHLGIVRFLVAFGCDVNAQDSDGWTPLHCAASCNNLAMVKFLVEHGACIFATTLSDHETAAEKCEEDEEGFDGCSEYLYSVQEKLGILNGGVVWAVYDYEAHNPDELSFREGDRLVVLRKGDENEREWWWSRLDDKEGYVPRNLLGLYPRVQPGKKVVE